MADRPEMFAPTVGVFGDGRFNGTMQNVVGPTIVAMAMKFGLGAEIWSPTGLSISTPRLGVYYFSSFTLSVCLSRSSFKSILFLFLYGIEPFLAVISPCGTLVVLPFLI